MARKFVIERNKAGECVAKFKHDGETIFRTEGYTREEAARTRSPPS